MRLRRLLIAVVAVGLAAAGIATCRRERAPAPTLAATVRGDLVETVGVTGRVVAAREVEIKCKASGEVLRLAVQESERVAKGAVLVELDPANEQRSLRRAELALASAQARLEQARANLAVAEEELVGERLRAGSALTAARTRAADAAARAERSAALLAQGLISAEEDARERTSAAEAADAVAGAEQRVADLATRERGLGVRRQDVILAEGEVASDGVALNDARERLAETRITAPIDGVVIKVNVAPGQIVSSGISTVGGGTTVLIIADTTRLEVVAQVDESDVAKIRLDQAATVTAGAFPGRSWTGRVARIGAKGAARNNTVEFETRVALGEDAAAALRPEMTATVAITTASAVDAVLVPLAAVTWRKDRAFVTRGDGGEVAFVAGASDGERIEAASGLEAGVELRLPEAAGRSRWRRESIMGGR